MQRVKLLFECFLTIGTFPVLSLAAIQKGFLVFRQTHVAVEVRASVYGPLGHSGGTLGTKSEISGTKPPESLNAPQFGWGRWPRAARRRAWARRRSCFGRPCSSWTKAGRRCAATCSPTSSYSWARRGWYLDLLVHRAGCWVLFVRRHPNESMAKLRKGVSHRDPPVILRNLEQVGFKEKRQRKSIL